MSDQTPIEKIFDIPPTPHTSFGDLVKSEREKQLIDPATGQVVQRKVEEVTDADLEKEERIEDLNIDGSLEEIRSSAMDSFEKQKRIADEVEPRFAARNAEVAAQFLKIALDAVGSRVDAKYKRNKIKLAKRSKSDDGVGSLGNGNTIIVADRNAVLDQILGKTVQGQVLNEEDE